MNLKEALIFAYGVIFATSTPYLKPKKRFLFPTATWKFDSGRFRSALTLFLGGSGICARLGADDGTGVVAADGASGPRGDVLLVNMNLGAAAEQWRSDLKTIGGAENAVVVLNSLNGQFGTPEEIRALGSAREVWAHADSVEDFARLQDALGLGVETVRSVESETVLRIGDETVRLIPVRGCAHESELVIFFEKRSMMMFGALFVNRIHPVLNIGVAHRVPNWIATLEELLARYSPEVCVPGEGEIGSAEDVREFVRYLRALTDDSVEFSECRKNFDWMEIPRTTSLEENYDILRRNVKTHTSIR